MGRSYQRKTRRSRRKLQDLQNQTVTVDVGEGKASLQMVWPLGERDLRVVVRGDGERGGVRGVVG